MECICQKNFEDVAYGNATLAENGCAVCCAAMLASKTPEEIVKIWGKKYWDNDFGTLPEAFDNAKDELCLSLSEYTENDVDLSEGSVYLLLAGFTDKHYEIINITPNGVQVFDPRVGGVFNIIASSAKYRITAADKVWKLG